MIETTGTQESSSESPPDSKVASAVRAALAVPGVRAVRVEPDGRGAALLRLELEDGADEEGVARAVDARVRVSGASSAPAPSIPAPSPAAPVEAAAPGAAAPSSPGVPAPARPARGGRVSVPAVSSPTVAATPAPQWLGESADEGAAQAVQPVAAAPGRPRPPRERLLLQRVESVTEGLTTTATVVLGQGTGLHTGVADTAATPTGTQRALATATTRALESAAAGRLRMEVDAVSLSEQVGEPTALVVLSVQSGRGAERLVGATLAGADPHRAIVKAVLAACNRRFGFDLAEAGSARS